MRDRTEAFCEKCTVGAHRAAATASQPVEQPWKQTRRPEVITHKLTQFEVCLCVMTSGLSVAQTS